MSIQDIINTYINKYLKKEQLYSVIGIATNINEPDRTCNVTPIDDTAIIYGVRLQSVIGSTKGLVQIPKNNSKVVVTFINKNAGIVTLCEEVEKILIDTDLVQFNGGTEELINITGLTTKLNLLQTELQTELGKIQVAIINLGGAYTMGTLSSFNKNNYKDTKIKH